MNRIVVSHHLGKQLDVLHGYLPTSVHNSPHIVLPNLTNYEST